MSTAARRHAHSYRERDEAILKHAALYGVLLNAVVSRLFFEGKSCGHVVRKLADAGALVSFPRQIPGGLSYARLSESACRRLGLPGTLAAPIPGNVLDTAIAAACYCCLDTQRRYRLTRNDLVTLYGATWAPANDCQHVLAAPEEHGRTCVLRLLVSGGAPAQAVKQLKRAVSRSEQNQAIARRLGVQGEYGFCLLAPTPAALAPLKRAVLRSGHAERQRICFGVGPTATTLSAYLKQVE